MSDLVPAEVSISSLLIFSFDERCLIACIWVLFSSGHVYELIILSYYYHFFYLNYEISLVSTIEKNYLTTM